jgi:hypothetical protein
MLHIYLSGLWLTASLEIELRLPDKYSLGNFFYIKTCMQKIGDFLSFNLKFRGAMFLKIIRENILY